MRLHLGVIDIPYADGSGTTTGDVARWLENKYAIMGHFYFAKEREIAKELENALAGAFENLRAGYPVSEDIFEAAATAIQLMFKNFIDQEKLNGIEGVPTAASIKGLSKRFKNGRGPGPRPSFIDTGTYVANFKVWMTEN